MINLAICDDNLTHLAALCNMVEQLDFQQRFRIYPFDSPVKMQECIFSGEQKIDAILCDILLGVYNGISVIASIQASFPDIRVAFVSGYPEYVFDAYTVRHLYFLKKPVQKDKMLDTLSRIAEDIGNSNTCYLYLRKKGQITKVSLDNILYIESRLRILHIVTQKNAFDIYQKLDDLKPLLDQRFLQCHKSYIVNLDYVYQLQKLWFVLQNGEKIRISAQRHPEVQKSYLRYIEHKIDSESYIKEENCNVCSSKSSDFI